MHLEKSLIFKGGKIFHMKNFISKHFQVSFPTYKVVLKWTTFEPSESDILRLLGPYFEMFLFTSCCQPY